MRLTSACRGRVNLRDADSIRGGPTAAAQRWAENRRRQGRLVRHLKWLQTFSDIAVAALLAVETVPAPAQTS